MGSWMSLCRCFQVGWNTVKEISIFNIDVQGLHKHRTIDHCKYKQQEGRMENAAAPVKDTLKYEEANTVTSPMNNGKDSRKKPLISTFARNKRRNVLQEHFEVVSTDEILKDAELRGRIQGLIVFPTDLTPDKLEKLLPDMKSLKVMISAGIGFDFMKHMFDFCRHNGIVVGYNPGNNGCDVTLADFIMAQLLSCARMVTAGHVAMKSCITDAPSFDKWRFGSFQYTHRVTGAALGIVGMGTTGLLVAKRARYGFDMNILYHNRRQREKDIEQSVSATYYADLDDMLPACDFVVIACDLNKQSHGMFGKVQFELMKKTSIIINMTRGLIIDTPSLVEALQDGVIAGAALDATEPEPLPQDHPLLSMPTVVITPHTAFSEQSFLDDVSNSIIETFKSVLVDGKIPDNAVVVPDKMDG